MLLQGVGLGVVLTVNDPVGMNAVGDADRGQAAGIINTAEQLGGAIGIAGLGALQLTTTSISCSAAWRVAAFTQPPRNPTLSAISSPEPNRKV